MTIRTSILLSGVLFLAAAHTPALAAEEERARAVIDAMISNLDAAMQPDAGKLIMQRDYQLAETNGVYTANFKEAAIVVDEGDMRIDFGPLAIDLEPIADKRVDVAFKFGDTIKVSKDGEIQARISLGSQSITGVWSEAYQVYLDSELQINDIQVQAPSESASATIASVAGTQKSTIDASDHWKMDQDFSVSNIDVKIENNGFSLATLKYKLMMQGGDFSKFKTMNTDMQAMAAKMEKDDEQAPMELVKFMSGMLNVFGAYAFTMQGDDLTVTSGGSPMASFKRIGMGSSMDTSKTDGSAFDFHFDLDGFDSMLAPLPPNILPRQARLEMAFSKIPAGVFDRVMEVALASVDVSKAERDALFQQQMMGFIMGSEMEFRLIDTFIAAQDARADLSLRSAVAPQAMLGGVGEMLLRIEGMQTLIDMTGAGQNQAAAPALTMLTAFSDRTEEDGKTVDTFDLKFTPDAKLMLNGKDISAMVMPGMMQ